MGKTPGKWIKNLLGKKSSKSSSLKKREILKPADKGEALVSINEPLPELPTESPLFLPPVPHINSRNESDSEKEITVPLQTPVVPLCSAKENGNAQTATNLATPDDSLKTRHEQAATLAQAAFRGYLARRAFRTLKGIIKLQALIRGHLARRQAVATFSCVWGIVKLQALVRGQKVRRSDIGIEALKIYSQGKLLDANYTNSSGLSLSTRAKRLRKNAYIQKLLATSPTVMPLHHQYGPGEANSAGEWLERWTKSHFWELHPQPKKNQDPKSQTKRSGSGLRTKETEQSRPKRNIRKPSTASVENGMNRSASDSEKRKRNIVKKVSSHGTNPVREHPSAEKDKVKRNLRKTSDSTKDVSKKSEVDDEKTKPNSGKTISSPSPDVIEHGTGTIDSAEIMKDLVVTSEQPDLETSLNLPAADGLVDELHDQAVVDEQHVEENGITESIQESDKELNLKNSQRRASLPGNIDPQENGLHSTPKLPSYMAPTESAKARLRGQGSPRFSLEGVEKNGTTRRLSLPSSNGKFSTPSPRAQRLIQGSGKGVVRSDRSLTSSRDGGIKNSWT